jgi:hypothetical protein
MANELIMPDGTLVDTGGPSNSELLLAIAQNTVAIAQQLQGTNRLLDLMVRLECNAVKRADLKRDILETEAAIKAAQAEMEAEAAPEVAETEDAPTLGVVPDPED